MSKDSDEIFRKYAIKTDKKCGEGGYGAVFKGTDKTTGEEVAVKVIDTRRMREEAIKKECQILETLTHKNVIKVKAHCRGLAKQAHLYFIFMELASGGELFDQVIDRGANAMPEPVALGFFSQLLDGVAYCHLAGVAHRDLKLENVLLNSAGELKLIDFGLSHVYPRLADGTPDRSKPLRDVCGSKSYAAPEVLAATGYDGFAADMWSLGVCLFAMLSGFFPLDEASAQDWRYKKMVESQATGISTTAAVYSWYRRDPRHLSREVVHLLDGLLNIDYTKRLTMADVRAHPWVHGQKFGGAAPADQAAYNARSEVHGDDGPAYRGVGAAPGHDDFQNYDAMDEDEMPVYRSLAVGDHDAEPNAIPALKRQRGKFELTGLEALDESIGLGAGDDAILLS